jgi:hypothetical protein
VNHGAGTVVNYGSITALTGNGVFLNTGGSITNAVSGSITAAQSGIGIYGAGTMVNDGSIMATGTGAIGVYAKGGAVNVVNDGNILGAGTAGRGVFLESGGSATNAASASITGSLFGVEAKGGAGTVDNFGSVMGAGTSAWGVFLESGGSVTNAASASIMGSYRSVEIEGGAGTVINDGGITSTGTQAIGVEIGHGGGAGTVDNHGGIVSTGSNGTGILLESGGSVANYGSVAATGTAGLGVQLSAGGSVTNAASASITGSGYGVLIHGGAGTVVNYGGITGTFNSNGTTGRGVQLEAGGSITNAVSASITGVYRGAEISGGAGVVVNKGNITDTGTKGNGVEIGLGGGTGTVVNYGSIASTFDAGIKLESGGSATNATSALITGGYRGVRVYGGAGTVVNFGSIVGTIAGVGTYGFGVELESGGSVSNAASASIAGSTLGVYLSAGGTLTNAGMIVGNSGTAVVLGGTGSNLLVLDPGFGFSGLVSGGASASNTLELASGASVGTLTDLGSSYVGFGQVTVGAFASWMLDGTNTVSSGQTLTELSGASLIDTGTLVNDGAIALDPSTMTAAGLTGTGSVTIEAGSTLDAQGTIAGGETLAFGGSGAYLHLDNPGSVAGSVTNFDFGETIDLKGVDPTSVNYAGDLLSFSGGSFALSLASAGTVTASASEDGADVTLLCFCANTLIQTPSGERPVQELAVGDEVTTHRGDTRPIVWIGTGKVLATRGRRNAATPVIVRRGALAHNVPHRDLRVTKGHSLYLDDVLIPVEFLVNHRSIMWDDLAQEVALYHIELATHDVLVADGAPAESYRDDGNRWLFQNTNSGWALPPQEPCAPVLTGGPVVDAACRRLLERAGPRPGLVLTDDPDLHVLADGERLDVTQRVGDAYVIHLPTVPSVLRIMSSAAAPAELGLARDPRVLGVALRRLVMRQGTRFRVTEANDDGLTDGFHSFEADNGFRWTDGEAAIPTELFAGFTGPVELVLHIGATARYLADSSVERVA